MFTLGDIVAKRARLGPNSCALVFGGVRTSYKDLDERSNRLANALLEMGLQPGDRVAILAENSNRFVEFLFGVAKAGMVATPLNFRLTERELEHMLLDSGARAVFIGNEFVKVGESLRAVLKNIDYWYALDAGEDEALSFERLMRAGGIEAPRVDVSENQLAMLIYTGGTTGLPKGVMLTHRNLISSTLGMCLAIKFTEKDVTLMALPMFHAAIWQVLCHLMVGACVVIMERPDVGSILKLLESERCTNMNAVPTLYNWMINDPRLLSHDLSSLRLLAYSGSPCPEEVLRKCIAHFGPIFAQAYGLTEAAPGVSYLPPEAHVLDGDLSKRLLSAGREMPLCEIRIVDPQGKTQPIGVPGEVTVRGPNVMAGYWNNKKMTEERMVSGWLYTGDIGSVDDEGYLYLLDRKADMIVSGGENVYPSEVEGVLYTHPAVKECIVSSAPDDKWGERVQAAVVLQPEANISEEELIDFCKKNLAGYKCPKQIEFWAELPKTVVGKLLRRDVKSRFWANHSRQIG